MTCLLSNLRNSLRLWHKTFGKFLLEFLSLSPKRKQHSEPFPALRWMCLPKEHANHYSLWRWCWQAEFSYHNLLGSREENSLHGTLLCVDVYSLPAGVLTDWRHHHNVSGIALEWYKPGRKDRWFSHISQKDGNGHAAVAESAIVIATH